MKRKCLGLFFMVGLSLLLSLFTSCDDLGALLNEQVVVITYSTEYGTKPDILKKTKDYVLTAENLPELSATGHTFHYWYDDETSQEVTPGFKVSKDLNLVALWDDDELPDPPVKPPVDDDDEVTINLYSYTDEVPGMVEKYLATHKDVKAKLNVTIIPTTNDEYQPALDKALKNGNVDIYVAEDAFVLKYTQGSMSSYAAPYEDFGIAVAKKTKAAETASYVVDFGTNKNGKVVGLGYQSTGGCFIYNRSQAKAVFGTDAPAIIQEKIGGGSGNWDKFWEAAAECAKKNVAIISGDGDIWHPIEASSDFGWVKDNKLYIDPKRGDFLEISKDLTDKGWSNGTIDWTDDWYADMSESGDKKVLGFFGPAWLINYSMAEKSGYTYGDWAVCESPVNFFWGGTWLLGTNTAANNSKKKAIVKDILEWITLDTTDTGLMYQWANGTFQWKYGVGKDTSLNTKDTVSSAVVMEKSNGEVAFLNGQNMFDYFVSAGKTVNAKIRTEYDSVINKLWREAVRDYASGKVSNCAQVVQNFKEAVNKQTGLAYDAEEIQQVEAKEDKNGGIKIEVTIPAFTDECSIYRFEAGTEDWVNDEAELYRIYNGNNSSAVTKTIVDRYGIEKGKTYKYGIVFNYDNRTKKELDFSVTATKDGWKHPVITNIPKGHCDGTSIVYDVAPIVDFGNGDEFNYCLQERYVKKDSDEIDWFYGFYPRDYKGEINKEVEIADHCKGLELTLLGYEFFVSVDDSVEYVRRYDADTYDFPKTIYSQNKIIETEAGFAFYIPVPAGTKNIAVERIEADGSETEILNKYYGDENVVKDSTNIYLPERYEYTSGQKLKYYVKYDWWRRYDPDKIGITYTPAYNGITTPLVNSDPGAEFKNNCFVYKKDADVTFYADDKDYGYWMQYIYYDADDPDNQDKYVYLSYNEGDGKKGASSNDITDGKTALTEGLELTLKEAYLNLSYDAEISGMKLEGTRTWKIPDSKLTNMPKTITIGKVEQAGISLTFTIPANTDCYSIRRFAPGTEDWEWNGDYEMYCLSNNTNKPVTKTIIDYYGLEKGKTYEYSYQLNYSENHKMNKIVTATANGKVRPKISNIPEASFDGTKLKYTVVPQVKYSNGEKYNFALEQSYLKVSPWWLIDGRKESEGDYTDWDFGWYPGYNPENEDAQYQWVWDNVKGFELTLIDYTFKVFMEDGVEYIAHYKPDAFNFPQKIYSDNAAKEITTEDGLSGIAINVPVPANTKNVAIYRYDTSAKEYVKIITKYYGDESAPKKGYNVTLTDFTDYKAGELKYYVEYDWWKRYDGYSDDNPKDERGISIITTKDGYKSPLVISGPSATFDGSKFNYTAAANLTWYTDKFDYWIQSVYASNDSEIYLSFNSSDWDKLKTAYSEPNETLNFAKGTEFKLKSATFNIYYWNDGDGYNIEKIIPLEKMSGMPSTITIK